MKIKKELIVYKEDNNLNKKWKEQQNNIKIN